MLAIKIILLLSIKDATYGSNSTCDVTDHDNTSCSVTSHVLLMAVQFKIIIQKYEPMYLTPTSTLQYENPNWFSDLYILETHDTRKLISSSFESRWQENSNEISEGPTFNIDLPQVLETSFIDDCNLQHEFYLTGWMH